MPFALLGYLLFLFMPALGWVFGDVAMFNVPFHLGATLASIVVFLPLYFYVYRRHARGRLLAVLGIFAIACMLLPWNAYANTYVIYAAALLGVLSIRMPLRIALLVAMLLLFGLQMYLLWPDNYAVFGMGLTMLISVSAFSSNYFLIEREKKRAALELSQDEVRRIAAFAERERIGRDLHDLLGHTLSMVALKADLAARLATRDADAATIEMREVARIAREALGEVRQAVSGIRSAMIAAELASAKVLLEADGVAVDAEVDELALLPEAESALAMALREAATNVLRHAGAKRLRVGLRREGDDAVLVVADDGRGGAIRRGNGLTGMAERLLALGGSVDVESSAGRGTRVIARLPLQAAT
ncbi:MAG: sensor histidine kinase [Xanthomonadaceae bacterium]|nr:sensor histidine kinase [Xanthomonadaceae bacterium]